MIRWTPLAAVLALATALTVLAVRTESAASRLDDADDHLARVLMLLQSAEAPRTNRAAYERHVQNAISMCRHAREQIRLAQQAPFLPPGGMPSH